MYDGQQRESSRDDDTVDVPNIFSSGDYDHEDEDVTGGDRKKLFFVFRKLCIQSPIIIVFFSICADL